MYWKKSRETEASLDNVEGKLEVIAPYLRHPHCKYTINYLNIKP